MTQLVCIVCPNGCRLSISGEGENIAVSGGKCPKGKAYAITEMTNPTRSVTTTVKTVFPEARVLPVRTNGEIPKAKIFDFMKVINSFVLDKRIRRGETVLPNVLDSGIDVIATSNALQK